MKISYCVVIGVLALCLMSCDFNQKRDQADKQGTSNQATTKHADRFGLIEAPARLPMHANPQVGQWAQWQIKGAASSSDKLSIVGQEGPDFWIERAGSGYILKMLVTPEGHVKKAYVGPPGGRGEPVKIKQDTVARKVLGTESIDVPAGPFECQKIEEKTSIAGTTTTTTKWLIQGGEFDGILAKSVTVMSSGDISQTTAEKELVMIDTEDLDVLAGKFFCIKLAYKIKAGAEKSTENEWRSQKIYFSHIAKFETSTVKKELARMKDRGAQPQLSLP